MNLSTILKRLRAQKGIRQQELAHYLKVSVGTVSNYETGVHEPDLNTLIKLAEFYNVSTDFLLGRTACPDFMDAANIPITDSYPMACLLRLLPKLTVKDKYLIVYLLRLLETVRS